MQGKMSERNKVYSYQITHKYIVTTGRRWATGLRYYR